VPYAENLQKLVEMHPLISESLTRAKEQRDQRLQMLLGGTRLRGLEALYAFLDAEGEAYDEAPEPEAEDAPDIRKLAFLVRRVRTDFEVALEAALSGYPHVASDAMRDVMEIEALLLFCAQPEHVAEWLSADRKTLVGKYGPGSVRKRLKDAGIEPWSSPGFVALDYQAHSHSLHVSPGSTPLTAQRGVSVGPFTIFDDVPFMEMFEHAHRVTYAIELLRVIAYRPFENDTHELLVDMDDFWVAHERTSEMQFVVVTMLTAPAKVKEHGRPGTAAEHMRFVAQEIKERAKSAAPADHPDQD
jgi:hypothetical protein